MMKKILFYIGISVVAFVSIFSMYQLIRGNLMIADASVCTSNPAADLTGHITTNGNAVITNKSANCSYAVGLASYKMYSNDINNQTIIDSEIKTVGPNQSVSLHVDVTSCAYQIDLFYGNLLTSFQGGARYGTRLLASSQVGEPNYCGTTTTPPNLTGSCSVNFSQVDINEAMTYSASASGGTGSYTYSWSGTDGLSGSSDTVQKSYTTSGTKTGTVRITSGNQSITKDCTVYVRPVQAASLTGSCSANPSDINVGDIVTFSTTATGGDGGYTYSWSGDEGVYGSSPTMRAYYNSSGTKQATVVITSNGQSITRNCTVYVRNNIQNNLSGSCSVSNSNPNINDTITFYATASGGNGNYTYSWSGDGNLYGSSQNVRAYYSSPGTYRAYVVITSNGQSITRQCNVTINQTYNNDLTASCYANTSNVNVNDTVTYYTNVSGGTGYYTYAWSGTDGLYGNSSSVQKQYNTIGQKQATVTVYSNGQSVSQTCNVYVSARPITYVPPTGGVYLNQVPYTGIGSNTKVALFMGGIFMWSAAIVYLIIRRRAMKGKGMSVMELFNVPSLNPHLAGGSKTAYLEQAARRAVEKRSPANGWDAFRERMKNRSVGL